MYVHRLYAKSVARSKPLLHFCRNPCACQAGAVLERSPCVVPVVCIGEQDVRVRVVQAYIFVIVAGQMYYLTYILDLAVNNALIPAHVIEVYAVQLSADKLSVGLYIHRQGMTLGYLA